MSAIEALKAARAAGIRLGIDGKDLTLEAAAAPPPAVLHLVITSRGWNRRAVALGEAFFDKRGGVAESDGGVSREEAEARAFAWCIVEWLNRNPVRSPAGRCHGCGQAEHAHDPPLPFGIEPTGHVWLHSRCWPARHIGRKTEAGARIGGDGDRGTGQLAKRFRKK